MSKGTIIYIGGFELPDKNAAAHRVLSNGKILKELGYNVVFLGVDNALKSNSSVLNTNKDVQGFDTWYIPYPKSKRQWYEYLSNIKSFIKVYNKYSDVKAVICYNYPSAAFLKLVRFCKLKSIKIIADCTEWYGAQGKGNLMRAIKGVDSFVRMRILQKKVDGLIVISKYLKNYYINHENLIMIPPLVDISEEKWCIQKVDNTNFNCLKLVYSGSPGFNKDKINRVIHGLYSLKDTLDYSFTIIGIKDIEYLNYYPQDKKIIEELSNKITFLGRISHVESLKELNHADYSIFFREKNIINTAGFPTKLVESISCGVPVITNDTSNIADYIESGINGFILGNNIEKDLKYVLSLPRDDLKRNVNKEQFDYQNYSNKVKKFIDKLFN